MYYNQIAVNQHRVTGKPKLSTMGKLFIGVLLVVVFEGAIRKWVTTSLTIPLLLLRDMMAFYGIVFAIKTNRMKFTQTGSRILRIWTVIFIFWGLVQVIVNQSSLLIFVIGARFWLLYLWFAYAAALSITENDFDAITKTILLLLLMMAPLTIMQHFLPPSSFLNKQLDGDEAGIFTVTAGIVRTTGTFSFTAGNTTFLAFAAPFTLALLTSSKKLWKIKMMPKACVLALGICTIVSGSRTAMASFALLFFIYVMISLLYSKSSKKAYTLIMIIIMLAMMALIPVVFSRAVESTQERVESAGQSENTSNRVFTILFGEPGAYKDMPLIGHGFGVGTNFAGVFATGNANFILGETEAARTILEGGMLGFVFIGLKIFVSFLGLRKSFIITRSTGNSLPLMLWVTCSLALFSWSIILQLTINALGFLLLGMAIASLRFNSKKV